MIKCNICEHRLKSKEHDLCASCDTLKIIRLERRIAELEAAQQKSKEMMRKARKDILETARANQMRLTGLDFVTGDTGCPQVEIHQRGIDESLLLCGEINDLISELPPMPEKGAEG